jgi:hypothetical protein
LILLQSPDHNALNVARRLCFTGHTSGYGSAFPRHFGIAMCQQKRKMPASPDDFRLEKVYSGWLAEA